jgi:hypothetical protein
MRFRNIKSGWVTETENRITKKVKIVLCGCHAELVSASYTLLCCQIPNKFGKTMRFRNIKSGGVRETENKQYTPLTANTNLRKTIFL